MSKYTTEVRFICETAAGYDESKGFDDVDEIITNSIDKIFSFDFPVFDDSYRNVLCTKILRHYYTREIGFETVGLWKLKMQTKLNEIMPYYNQLYKSELLKFNPLYDVDLNTTHASDKTSENNTISQNNRSSEVSANGLNNRTSENNTSAVSNGNTENNASAISNENTENTKTGSADKQENKNGIINGVTDKVDSGKTNKDSTYIEGSSKETQNVSDGSSASVGGSKSNKTGESTESGKNEKNEVASNNYSDSESGINYDLYSDTPQGALTDVNQEEYLTNARKITDSKSKTGKKDDTKVGNDKYDKSTETESEESVESSAFTNETIKNNYIESNDKTNIGNDITEIDNTSKINDTKTNVESAVISESNNYQENGKNTQSSVTAESGKNTQNSITNENANTSEISVNKENTNASENGTTFDKYNSTESYVLHVVGKQGGYTFSRMLKEFRDTFLNIDLDVINSLSDLFLNLW